MRILLTNDDGINAPGFAVLEEIAATLSDDIWVVAPAEEQSGAGHSLTLTAPLRLRELGERRYSVTGTPTDAVMMGINRVMKDNPPDLLLSGVNRGANLAEDVTYSGTVSAAMEGALAGVPSVALSQTYGPDAKGDDVPFSAAREWGGRVLEKLRDYRFPSRTLVNINFPARTPDAVRGIRTVSQGMRDYGRLQIIENRDPRGFPYYWFGLGPMVGTPEHSTDLEAIEDGYIAVSPLHLDMTHRESLNALGAIFD